MVVEVLSLINIRALASTIVNYNTLLKVVNIRALASTIVKKCYFDKLKTYFFYFNTPF